ncbi:MAG: helix-turn-helix transcriptional regulator [Verrucomicrobiae bacterium]|nr:helix-turn-helix transcriptional regulator [Verrucomicrobiae bacterium]MCP5550548.1 helix-turn-helix transcriptional regulator [Akkermansiaceae bacterium]
MKEQEVTKSELARRIGTSPAYVTKILRGETNFTLDTMVKIAHALNCRLQTHLARQGFRTHWLDEAESETRVFVTKEVPELNATDFADVDASFSAAA